jgi:methylase of polypeptide subunit release factors
LQTGALLGLLCALGEARYRFIATTPLTHRRLLDRRTGQLARGLRDVFGWNMPFAQDAIPWALLALMEKAGVLLAQGNALRSAVRFSSIDDTIFLHSSFPTVEDDSVFFGPDTYRFVRFIEQSLPRWKIKSADTGFGGARRPLRVLDVGCGSGAGGLVAAMRLAQSGIKTTLTMNDINPCALRFTAINAEALGMPVELAPGDALPATTGQFDLIISNPPYMADVHHRAYRDGGANMGLDLSLRIATEALARLAPGGRLLLYTGVAIVDGVNPLTHELAPVLDASGCDWSSVEIDPDVFGEELEEPPYARAERIAAVGLTATKRRVG